jgi:hypothetical protein
LAACLLWPRLPSRFPACFGPLGRLGSIIVWPLRPLACPHTISASAAENANMLWLSWMPASLGRTGCLPAFAASAAPVACLPLLVTSPTFTAWAYIGCLPACLGRFEFLPALAVSDACSRCPPGPLRLPNSLGHLFCLMSCLAACLPRLTAYLPALAVCLTCLSELAGCMHALASFLG